MKNGIDYFPLDVHLDDKFKLIEAEFGLTGFAVIVKLFQKIYGEQGYYCEWTKEVALLFARDCGAGGSVVSEIVSAAIKRGIFDKDLFEKYGILTSKGIQSRYFEAVSRRINVTVENRYLLVSYAPRQKNVCNSGENVDIFSENADSFEQSKVDKSRVNKSIVNQSKEEESKRAGARVAAPSLKDVEEYISERGYHFSARRFLHYYADHGGCPENWRSKCDFWEDNQHVFNSRFFYKEG